MFFVKKLTLICVCMFVLFMSFGAAAENSGYDIETMQQSFIEYALSKTETLQKLINGYLAQSLLAPNFEDDIPLENLDFSSPDNAPFLLVPRENIEEQYAYMNLSPEELDVFSRTLAFNTPSWYCTVNGLGLAYFADMCSLYDTLGPDELDADGFCGTAFLFLMYVEPAQYTQRNTQPNLVFAFNCESDGTIYVKAHMVWAGTVADGLSGFLTKATTDYGLEQFIGPEERYIFE